MGSPGSGFPRPVPSAHPRPLEGRRALLQTIPRLSRPRFLGQKRAKTGDERHEKSDSVIVAVKPRTKRSSPPRSRRGPGGANPTLVAGTGGTSEAARARRELRRGG